MIGLTIRRTRGRGVLGEVDRGAEPERYGDEHRDRPDDDAADDDRAQVEPLAAGEPSGVGQRAEVAVDRVEEVDRAADEDEQDQGADHDRRDAPRPGTRRRIVRSRLRRRALPWRSCDGEHVAVMPSRCDGASSWSRVGTRGRAPSAGTGGSGAGRRKLRLRGHMAAQASLRGLDPVGRQVDVAGVADRRQSLRRTGRGRRTRRRPGSRPPWRC